MRNAKAIVCIFFLLLGAAACGDDFAENGSCRYEVQCDGSECVGISSGCTSGDLIEEEGITSQATCQAWAETIAEDKNGTLKSATFDSDGDC
jgi:hypothetical protein